MGSVISKCLCIAVLCSAFLVVGPPLRAQEQTEETAEAEPKKSFASKTEEFIWQGWDFALGMGVKEIIEHLGRPGKIATRRVKNRYNPSQVDTISRLFYSGLDVATYRAGDDEKEMVVLLAVKNGKYKTKFGIGIDSKKDEVIRILGTPSKQKANLITYEDERKYAQVNFHLRNDTVHKIEWLVSPDSTINPGK